MQCELCGSEKMVYVAYPNADYVCQACGCVQPYREMVEGRVRNDHAVFFGYSTVFRSWNPKYCRLCFMMCRLKRLKKRLGFRIPRFTTV